jgi:phosphoribosylformylglycinamidine cyclo-ligase
MSKSPSNRAPDSLYRDAGVDLQGAASVKRRLRSLVEGTLPAGAVGPGLFSGLLPQPDGSYLAATVDGVGTKTRVAGLARHHRGIGVDIVHHCADDLLAVNARPLFFLDYFGSSRLEPALLLEIIEGMAEACRDVGAALLGGETAQMPGTYVAGEYDVVGCMVGRVAPGTLLTGAEVRAGDRVLGLASDGLHTNGYSLARSALLEGGRFSVEDRPVSLGGESVGEALLRPHRHYGPAVAAALAAGGVTAMAHITGGGIEENLARVLPEGKGALINAGSWNVPAIFRLIGEAGGVPEEEMRRVFNMGIGFCLTVRPGAASAARVAAAASGIKAFEIGEIVGGDAVLWRERPASR